ncbi:MAG: hypothetical protein NC301_00370 [Bacteroides sp.]|nr:hypothetical protein [Bacteroides sp.]MCM1379362.1 hypothetical protein [Bacteroides sp.]MCM1445222.1 hypothetical protein [Prevotella sp.]
MRKDIFLIASLTVCAASLRAQDAVDLFTFSESQLRGTARYMSMGGAFGALGGDISTLTQNPAGIGVYRSSDISATLDIDGHRSTLSADNPRTITKTNAACNNFGYVGAVNINNAIMPYFQWGASYNRLNSFERHYVGNFNSLTTSWSNFVADSSQGYSEAELQGAGYGDNPYNNPDNYWPSALAYNCYLISPNPYAGQPGESDYVGLFKGNSSGTANADVYERGYIDEYSINFGGNFSDMVYWGIGFGIRDLSFTRSVIYGETINNALVPYPPQTDGDPTVLDNGRAGWDMETYQRVSGSGFNLKFGLIFKPINEFRIGLAVHTPTWYNLNFQQSAAIDYSIADADDVLIPTIPDASDNINSRTGTGFWSQSLKTPWRLMASVAGVIGGRFIISADYIYEAFPSMSTSDDDPVTDDITADVKQYFKGSNELRLGAEVRVTPKFSVRAGYGYKSSAAATEAYNGNEYIYTSGVNTMYTFSGDRHNLSLGVGFKFGQFSIDAAYVHSSQTSQWNAFSPFPRQDKQSYALTNAAQHGPSAQLRDTHNRFALTLGFRF